MPRTKRRERHKLNKTKKIYYGGNDSCDIKNDTIRTIQQEYENNFFVSKEEVNKINEINEIITLNQERNLTKMWILNMCKADYILNEVTNNALQDIINKRRLTKLSLAPHNNDMHLFHMINRDKNQGGYRLYMKINNGDIIDISKEINITQVESPAKEIMKYYKGQIVKYDSLLEKIKNNKQVNMNIILIQILFFQTQSHGATTQELYKKILDKSNAIKNVYTELDGMNISTVEDSSYNTTPIDFTINNNNFIQTINIKDNLTLNILKGIHNDNHGQITVGYITGTIKIDYLNQTYTENISIHIDPRVTYANKLLPPPAIGADAGADTGADAGAIDNEDITDIFFSPNLNKNQNYYIFNMLETMS